MCGEIAIKQAYDASLTRLSCTQISLAQLNSQTSFLLLSKTMIFPLSQSFPGILPQLPHPSPYPYSSTKLFSLCR